MLAATWAVAADSTVQSNVVYGMYSGTALLMDVHRPATPNGYGIVYVSGSGWTSPMAYSSWELKSNAQSLQYAKPLVAAGYTVFTLNHPVTPALSSPGGRRRRATSGSICAIQRSHVRHPCRSDWRCGRIVGRTSSEYVGDA